jgi:hypothetical protein
MIFKYLFECLCILNSSIVVGIVINMGVSDRVGKRSYYLQGLYHKVGFADRERGLSNP